MGGTMDQGWAAVLGALVGALATGGGALVTTRSSTRLHKRQARREACKAFLAASHRFCSEASQLLSFIAAEESALRADDEAGVRVRGSLLGMLTALQGVATEVQTHTAAVMLEGPPEITVKALEICGNVTGLTGELFGATTGEGVDRESLDTLRQRIFQGTLEFALHANPVV
ncbi:hypothetical protein GCM10010234_01390 [Streptomyces hawaiiensis]